MKQQYDFHKVRKLISTTTVLDHFDVLVNQYNRIVCYWHDDSDPSCQDYGDHLWCWSCGAYRDVISLVAAIKKCSLYEAAQWIMEHTGTFPEIERPVKKTEYIGPVPRLWIDYWAKCLTNEKKQYLYGRGLTDQTILTNRIGWRIDLAAYVFPFWKGLPGESDVEIVQYRFTGEGARYGGEKGYNKPSILGRHLVNPDLIIILFGVFDQYTAEQDGIPAISLNGVNAFMTPEREESLELKELLKNVKRKIIIPDSTPQEFLPAEKLVWFLEGELKFFPANCPYQGKDYNDLRVNGMPVDYFKMEVLNVQGIST